MTPQERTRLLDLIARAEALQPTIEALGNDAPDATTESELMRLDEDFRLFFNDVDERGRLQGEARCKFREAAAAMDAVMDETPNGQARATALRRVMTPQEIGRLAANVRGLL